MIPIANSEARQKRYFSLKQKYDGNSEFECAYSKISDNEEFDGYIFSLENTTDYNPDDYVAPLKSEDYFKDQLLLASDELDYSQNNNKSPRQTKNFSKFDSKFESGNLLYAFEVKNSRLKEYPSSSPEIP